ncbi:MAG: hypothetical protein IPK04_15975 [Bdellovibrionales bacterium]|nr:hypothetical protein [Bdellovibrionales bacterium]
MSKSTSKKAALNTVASRPTLELVQVSRTTTKKEHPKLMITLSLIMF